MSDKDSLATRYTEGNADLGPSTYFVQVTSTLRISVDSRIITILDNRKKKKKEHRKTPYSGKKEWKQLLALLLPVVIMLLLTSVHIIYSPLEGYEYCQYQSCYTVIKI